LVCLDLSEYKTPASLERLIGNGVPSGRGTLGNGVSRTDGGGTLLFDEMEKAHPDVIDVLLQILSAARVSLATGEALDLSGYVVAATTNLGAEVLLESETLDSETIRARVLTAVQLALRPELVARFPLKVVFNAFDYESSYRIAELHAQECLKVSCGLGHRVDVTPGVIEHIRRQGYDRVYGVRPLRDKAMEVLGDAMADLALATDRPVEGTVVYDPENDRCMLVSPCA
jgi:ATP-dependent Clp protease ATP-binding subunit ClpB